MSVERNLIISVLKLTKDGETSDELVKNDAGIPAQVAKQLLRKLQNDGLLKAQGNVVKTDSLQRLKLAISAHQLGADIEHVSRYLLWKEFEDIAGVALRQNSYSVTENLRFKHGGRRWEIDVVACRKPITLCVDCKRWQRAMTPSAIKRVVNQQVERTRHLADHLPNPSVKIECTSWERTAFVPVVLSLATGSFKFYDDVPIVSVLQLQDFLTQLPAYVSTLKSFTKRSANKLNCGT